MLDSEGQARCLHLGAHAVFERSECFGKSVIRRVHGIHNQAQIRDACLQSLFHFDLVRTTLSHLHHQAQQLAADTVVHVPDDALALFQHHLTL